ncbi:hypothetical protein ACOMCU_24390 [Lysinibacillus sp. UGB7]|uniref:hypothetical protein n=1 Tax=Lysinibacillus sp. UGB7 TaxID=3411039 RepID=UPI003B7705FE
MTVYDLCMFLINRKRYTYEAMKNKVNVFYANNQLADEEFTDLLSTMDEQTEETQAEA